MFNNFRRVTPKGEKCDVYNLLNLKAVRTHSYFFNIKINNHMFRKKKNIMKLVENNYKVRGINSFRILIITSSLKLHSKLSRH